MQRSKNISERSHITNETLNKPQGLDNKHMAWHDINHQEAHIKPLLCLNHEHSRNISIKQIWLDYLHSTCLFLSVQSADITAIKSIKHNITFTLKKQTFQTKSIKPKNKDSLPLLLSLQCNHPQRNTMIFWKLDRRAFYPVF